ncbi:unnamed protein product, partial [Discosporangium mesarthrocarpum]
MMGLPKRAPRVLHRCFAVLRALASQPSVSYFMEPVDPARNASYFDTIVKPLALSDVGHALRASATELARRVKQNHRRRRLIENEGTLGARADASSAAAKGITANKTKTDQPTIREGEEGETVSSKVVSSEAVSEFIRGVRLVLRNATACHAPLTPTWLAAEKLGCVFERLLMDWVLDPKAPPVKELDDDLCRSCLDHSSDHADDLQLMCDRCDAKYHLKCLGMYSVPAGDWFCIGCVGERKPHPFPAPGLSSPVSGLSSSPLGLPGHTAPAVVSG